MTLRFFAALSILLIALALQLALAAAGFHFNLALAVLIALAFIVDFWELFVFVLVASFILNWQPAISMTLVAFAVIPFAVYLFRKTVNSEPWIGNLIAIVVGFLIFYIAVAPGIFFTNFTPFLLDLFVGLIAGEAALFALG